MANEKRLREILETIIRGSQANFDHLSGDQKEIARRFNELANDVAFLFEAVGLDLPDADGAEDTPAPRNIPSEHSDLDGVTSDQHHDLVHTHEDAGEGGTIDHGALDGLGDDDHPQYATDADLTAHEGTPHGGGGVDLAEGYDMGGDPVVVTTGETVLTFDEDDFDLIDDGDNTYIDATFAIANASDFDPTDLDDGDMLQYVESTGLWVAVPPPEGGGGGAVVGGIIGWGTDTPPDGWLICDGSAVSRTTYADLFDVIGETFGVGDGSTTFNLPNLKGRVPVGKDSAQTEFDALAETGGAKTHTLTTDELPAHTHGAAGAHTHPATGAHTHTIDRDSDVGGGNRVRRGTNAGTLSTQTSSSDGNHQHDGVADHTHTSVGGGSAHQNLQPYLVINFIICHDAAGGGGGGGIDGISVQEEDVEVVATATALDFAGDDFNVTDDGSGEARIALASVHSGEGAYINRQLDGKTAWITDEFVGPAPGSAAGTKVGQWTLDNSGTSTSIGDGADDGTDHFGVWNATTGSTNSGYASLHSASALRVGGGTLRFGWRVRIPTLSTSAQRFIVRVGMFRAGNADTTRVLGFKYSDDLNDGEWQGIAFNGTDTSTLDTNVPVQAGVWYFLEVLVAADGASAEFFINGASVGTISSHIPASANQFRAAIAKTVGNTGRIIDIDYFAALKRFTSDRW